MIYEVWIRGGVDLDYFGSREAAELYILECIQKRNTKYPPRLVGPWSAEDFEIREKTMPTGCDYGIGG